MAPRQNPVEGRAEGPLDTYGNRFTPPTPSEASGRQERRTSRHKLKQAQRRITASKSSRLCWSSQGLNVVVDVGAALTAHVSGINRCGSPWACPVCAPVVRQRKAEDIDLGLSRWLSEGHGALFVTQTLKHSRGDELGPRLDVVSQALKLCLRGNSWVRRAEALGYVGGIKALEVTDGINGWHPHCHSVLCFEEPVSIDQQQDFSRWLYGRWSAVVQRKGFGEVSRKAFDVQAVSNNEQNGERLADYLTKVEGGWGAGLELARSDLKAARRGGITPVQLLVEFVETGDVRLFARWLEYEAATHGKRAVVWSPGLRARLLGDDQEASDVELAAAEGADLALMRALVERARWAASLSWGTTGELLSEIEQAAAAFLLMVRSMGHEPQPLEKAASQIASKPLDRGGMDEGKAS